MEPSDIVLIVAALISWAAVTALLFCDEAATTSEAEAAERDYEWWATR